MSQAIELLVVTPAFVPEHSGSLDRCIESVRGAGEFALKYTGDLHDYRHVLVGWKSEQGVEDHLSQYEVDDAETSRLTVLRTHNKGALGVAGALNGTLFEKVDIDDIAIAGDTVVWPLEARDRLGVHSIATVVAFRRSRPDAQLVYGYAQIVTAEGEVIDDPYHEDNRIENSTDPRKLLGLMVGRTNGENRFPNGTVTLDASNVWRVGELNKDITAGDLELYARSIAAGVSTAMVSAEVCIHTEHPKEGEEWARIRRAWKTDIATIRERILSGEYQNTIGATEADLS